MAEDGAMPQLDSSTMSPGLSQQDADEVLAKDFFERMDARVATDGRYRVTVPVPRTMTTGVLADALTLLIRKHPRMAITIVRNEYNRLKDDVQLCVEF